MNPPDANEYLWINRWEDFQSFQKKRGKPWAPPWIRVYPKLLDDPAFVGLPELTQLLLIKLWMLFSRTHGNVLVATRNYHGTTTELSRNPRGTLTWLTRSLAESLHQRVTKQQLERLNHAGFITTCSGTVLEQRHHAFWNGSNLDIEVDVEREPKAVPLTSYDTNGNGLGSEISKSKSSIYPTHEVPF